MNDQELKQVDIYTDGGCISNPGGNGGYGVVLLYNGKRKELSGGFANTTNNRMELMAAIKGLEALKEKCSVNIYSDSKYLTEAIEQRWIINWMRKGWMRTKTEEVKNVDLWKRLWAMIQKHEVKFNWVRGHAGNPENERCDQLATIAMNLPNLVEDVREGNQNFSQIGMDIFY